MGVACVFSKIQPKATIIATISLLIVALVTHVLPILGLILCLFATIPGIVLWNRSVQSFGISALVTVILTTLLGNTFVLSMMVLILILSFIIGQLLKERTSKERILLCFNGFIEFNNIDWIHVITNIRKNSKSSRIN